MSATGGARPFDDSLFQLKDSTIESIRPAEAWYRVPRRGGKRDFDKYRRYIDAYGYPHFMITFRPNEQWPEMADLPRKDQGRLDLLLRVFFEKCIILKELIMSGYVFGDAACYFSVVEFPSRGLPCQHVLVTLKNQPGFHLRPRDVDRYVSAELPPPGEDGQLRSLVVTHMLHQCMRRQTQADDNSRCLGGFPQRFTATTHVDGNSEVRVKRADRPQSVVSIPNKKMDRLYNNQDDVPYNMILLKMFNSYVNVLPLTPQYFYQNCIRYLFRPSPDYSAYFDCRDVKAKNNAALKSMHGRKSEAVWSLLGFETVIMTNKAEILATDDNDEVD